MAAGDESTFLLLTNGKDNSAKLWDTRRLDSNAAMRQHVSQNASDMARFDYRFNWAMRGRGRGGGGGGGGQQHHGGSRSRATDHSLHTFVNHTVAQTLIRANFAPLASTGHGIVYSGSATGDVFLWSTLSGELVDVLNGCHRSIVRDCHWHPSAPVIGTASWDGTSVRIAYRK